MAVAKVSMLKRLTKVSVTEPLAPIATSPSYQPIPNGAFGFWIANRTSGVPGLKPLTVMTSFSVKVEPVAGPDRPLTREPAGDRLLEREQRRLRRQAVG